MSTLTALSFAVVGVLALPSKLDKNRVQILKVDDMVASLTEARQLASASDRYYAAEATGLGDAFWTFGADGVRVFSNDGSTVLWRMQNEDICELRESCFRGQCQTMNDCSFYSAVSDGHEYVFASKDENGGKVAIFSMSRGLYLGSYPTCARPVAIDYAPHRSELWVHCFSPDDEIGDSGHLDVLSTTAWGVDHAQIVLPNQTLGGHTHGWIELDAMTPDYAWASTREQPYLAKINVHSKEVETFDMSDLGCGALNEVAVSWRNRFYPVLFFLRARTCDIMLTAIDAAQVCCSCGLDADTQSECGSSATQVRLRDGTSALGYCGIGCDGTAADTVGLIEFNTVTGTVVSTHYWPDFGSGNPIVSTKGDFVITESPINSAVKVLEVGANGIASSDSLAEDVNTDFTPGSHRDTLFIQDEQYDLVALSSVAENFVVIAHLDDVRGAADIGASKVSLTYVDESTATSGRRGSRPMAWAAGTPYMMVSGAGANELYIIDIGSGQPTDARLFRTIIETPSSFIIHVQTKESAAPSDGSDGKDGDDAKDVLGIVALIIATVALFIVMVLAVVVLRTNHKTQKDTKSTIYNEVHAPSPMGSDSKQPTV